MFKKSKKLNPAPSPITVEEVLSDLETFAVPKAETEAIRTISPNDPDYPNQWWRAFQTFMDDLETLKRLQRTMAENKDGLTEQRRDIDQMIVDLEKGMARHKKFIESIPPHL